MPLSFQTSSTGKARPNSIRSVQLPRRERQYHPSPQDWRHEILYFLLPDRFSDGSEKPENLLDRTQLTSARPAPNGQTVWQWNLWARSGKERWQGGTIKGITSKLDYLKGLGVTAVWVGPVFKQRVGRDTYHGYGIQDFLEVDPRFGTRQDLCDLVDAAHQRGMRIILDIIFNHSGSNWLYPVGTPNHGDVNGRFEANYTENRYGIGEWRDENDNGMGSRPIAAPNEAVWPTEFQDFDHYTRAGTGDLGKGDIEDPNAEFRRTDFGDLRDVRTSDSRVLGDIASCYKYWIALTDCDGFRIDTLKHVSEEDGRNFCGAIKEYAKNLGKRDFFLVAEVAGGDNFQDRYLDAIQQNLNAVLDIGGFRINLDQVAKGLAGPTTYFDGFSADRDYGMGSHRAIGSRHVSVLNDHDHVFGEKLRLSARSASDHQIVVGMAIQLFSLGIPCIYYGTEQALASGPTDPADLKFLFNEGWGNSDAFLRETMFGPLHPRQSGKSGLPPNPSDTHLPGFGAFGTAGKHCFDPNHPAYVRIAALTKVRADFPALRDGRQYLRPISNFGGQFAFPGSGEIAAWSRILDDEEILCVANTNGGGGNTRGGDIVVDALLSPPGSALTVLVNTAEVATGNKYKGTHRKGEKIKVQAKPDGTAFVSIREVGPSEVVLLTNHP